MTLEATFFQEGHSLDHTPASALTAGTVMQLADGTAAVPANDVEANALGSVHRCGVFKVAAATGTTWSDGDELWWDESAAKAVKKALTLDGSADFRLGIAVGAKASGPLFGYVRLNDHRPPFTPIVFEFDCQTGVDTADHVLVPAEMNPNGLVITSIFALVTEVFAGTEDQGIVTVSDEDDTALATLTPTDAGADAVGDIIEGFFLHEAATGAAGVVVPAGKYIDAAVTQVTTGAAAGKMKVYITAIPLV